MTEWLKEHPRAALHGLAYLATSRFGPPRLLAAGHGMLASVMTDRVTWDGIVRQWAEASAMLKLHEVGPLFEDGVAIDAALAEAALAAQREARALGRPLVVWEDDHLTRIPPDQIPGGSPASTPSTSG